MISAKILSLRCWRKDKRLFAYKFKGYWKDVGTIDSLWEANMDLLDKNNELDLNDPSWKIYTEDATTLPHYIGPDANIKSAFINQGCIISGDVENSVLYSPASVWAKARKSLTASLCQALRLRKAPLSREPLWRTALRSENRLLSAALTASTSSLLRNV